jgi:hypothetical protein
LSAAKSKGHASARQGLSARNSRSGRPPSSLCRNFTEQRHGELPSRDSFGYQLALRHLNVSSSAKASGLKCSHQHVKALQYFLASSYPAPVHFFIRQHFRVKEQQPNPSIEQTSKKLRFLYAAHVKR